MRVPLSWIQDFTPLQAEPRAIATALDRLGIEVEAIHEPGRETRGVVTARVLDVRDHPNADTLTVVDVDHGRGTTTVVCGAHNVVAGMVVPYAPPGATLPGGVTLERRRIRGQVSDGMLCSARELGLGDDHEGILAIEGVALPGADVREVLGLDEVVFELAITPNRPDAMSMVGVARELAAHFGLPLTVPTPVLAETGAPTAAQVTVVVEAEDRCPRFTARVLDVDTGPSPEWMRRRLALAGMRAISNVVDATNYVMLERGQPLHAFDLDRLAGPGIVVRLGRDGEVLRTLDGVDRHLVPSDLLICDATSAPQAIAGVMGGAQAEVHEATRRILLEAAYFEPMGIARTSKRLGLRSEASARFERGVDPNGVLRASARAAELMQQVAGARVAPGPIDAYPTALQPARIRLRTARAGALLGIPVSAPRVRDALEPLGIAVEGDGDELTAVAPTFRPDLTREIDLVEEIARRVGLDEIPRTLPSTTRPGGGLTRLQRERRLVADALVGLGLLEAMTVPLLSRAVLTRIGYPGHVVEATNALRAEEPVLRPLIFPGLLGALARNAANGITDLSLFEIGHVFRPPTPDSAPLPDEQENLAVVMGGSVRRRPVEPDRTVDVFDAVDAWRAVADALELADWRLRRVTAPGLHPARTAAIVVDGAVAGHVSEHTAAVLAAFGIPGPVVGFEVALTPVWRASRRDRTFRSPSRFPVSSIDLAFVVDDAVLAGDVERTLRETAGDLLEDVRCFDEYRTAAPGPARRSLAFALRFRAPDRTLTDAEVGELRAACIEAVTRAHGATLRT